METKGRSWKVKKSLVACLILALCAVACETMPETAALAGALGAGTGAIIGHQRGRAIEGALIGAAVGAATGALAHKARERQLASRAEVEQEYRAKGVEVPAEPLVEIEDLQASPDRVQRGETVLVRGRYIAIGTDEPRPEGAFRLLKDGAQLAAVPLEISNTGRNEFTKEIDVTDDLPDGAYECEVTIQQGDSLQVRRVPFMVASSS